MLNRQTFNKGWAFLTGAFPEFLKSMDPGQIKATVAVYWESLKDFDDSDFSKVIKAHIAQNKYFPKIAELREELVRLKGFHCPTAAQAWETLIKEAEAGTEDYQGDEATMRALAAVGGWRTFQFTNFKELNFRFKDFKRTYDEALEQQDRQIKLGGASERQQIGEQKKLEVIK